MTVDDEVEVGCWFARINKSTFEARMSNRAGGELVERDRDASVVRIGGKSSVIDPALRMRD